MQGMTWSCKQPANNLRTTRPFWPTMGSDLQNLNQFNFIYFPGRRKGCTNQDPIEKLQVSAILPVLDSIILSWLKTVPGPNLNLIQLYQGNWLGPTQRKWLQTNKSFLGVGEGKTIYKQAPAGSKNYASPMFKNLAFALQHFTCFDLPTKIQS